MLHFVMYRGETCAAVSLTILACSRKGQLFVLDNLEALDFVVTIAPFLVSVVVECGRTPCTSASTTVVRLEANALIIQLVIVFEGKCAHVG